VRFSGYSVAKLQDFRLLRRRVSPRLRRAVHARGRLHVALLRRHRATIEMVNTTAVGGRLSILGAVYGTLLVNAAKTSFPSRFPQLCC